MINKVKQSRKPYGVVLMQVCGAERKVGIWGWHAEKEYL